METKFDQLVTLFNVSSSSTDILQEIIFILEEQTNESISLFFSQSFKSLLLLKHWIWQLLSEDYHQWINHPYYQEFFYTFASFNKKMIFHYENIEIETKVSLLFPDTIDQINNIFKQIEQNLDNNDSFITIISLYFDNHSYFICDNPQYSISSIYNHLGQYIVHNYFMSKSYKFYLNQLRQSSFEKTIFTPKMLFYIKTCSFYLSGYLNIKCNDFPYTVDEILQYISDDYLQIISIHSHTVTLWNKELLSCIAQLIGLIYGCFWWNGEKRTQIKIIFPTEQLIYNHIQDVIRIIAYKPFYKQTKSVRSNDETTLMDSTLMLLLIIVQTQNINWFFRSNIIIRDTIISVAEAALNDEVCLCGYGILGEALADEDLKKLKIADNISDYFFTMLDEAWNHPSKKYKQVPVTYLLRGFQNLSKNDSIQQRTFQLNKISLFIEMCDEHPIAFDIIWALSFNQNIQQQLRSNTSFISKLYQLSQECNNEQMRKTIHGIMWNLEINREDRSIIEINDENTFDIMISYSHKDKILCKQIYDELIKIGYRVWIDIDQMHGNMMDAMAQGIERSQIIIICMSEEYRKSNYCRAEAQYAFQRQRQIVPILLQKRYKPDGWLLFLTSQLLYVDFTKHEFNRAMKMLLKELKAEDIHENNRISVQHKEDSDATPPVLSLSSSITFSENILEWTPSQVQNWLVEHDLIQMSRLLRHCNGRSLVYLNKYMKSCSHQQILTLLQEDSLRRTNENISLIELSCFHSLMDQQRKLLQSTDRNIQKKDS